MVETVGEPPPAPASCSPSGGAGHRLTGDQRAAAAFSSALNLREQVVELVTKPNSWLRETRLRRLVPAMDVLP